MVDEPHVIHGIDWRQAFPFVNIFRAFRVAIHPSKLLLALAALLLMYFGGRALDMVWSKTYWATPQEFLSNERTTADSEFSLAMRTNPEGKAGPFITFLSYESSQLNALAYSVPRGNLMENGAVGAVLGFVAWGPGRAIQHHPCFFPILFFWF